jgi:hypothetical protein
MNGIVRITCFTLLLLAFSLHAGTWEKAIVPGMIQEANKLNGNFFKWQVFTNTR